MCTYYYLHYHHISPCARVVDYTVHYTFCGNATTASMSAAEASSLSLLPPDGSHPGDGSGNVVVQQPCAALFYYAPEYNPVDYSSGSGSGSGSGSDPNTCGLGGCLVSQQCSSGACRLQDLGGRWTCCRCRRGGNTFRRCVHPMRKVPDTLCYHVVCQNCEADVSA